MSISFQLTIVMREIDINYIYDTSHISHLTSHSIPGPGPGLTTSKRRLYRGSAEVSVNIRDLLTERLRDSPCQADWASTGKISTEKKRCVNTSYFKFYCVVEQVERYHRTSSVGLTNTVYPAGSFERREVSTEKFSFLGCEILFKFLWSLSGIIFHWFQNIFTRKNTISFLFQFLR